MSKKKITINNSKNRRYVSLITKFIIVIIIWGTISFFLDSQSTTSFLGKLFNASSLENDSSFEIYVKLTQLIGLLFILIELILMNESDLMNMSYQLYNENVSFRTKHDKAHSILKEMKLELEEMEEDKMPFKNRNSFDEFYSRDNYKELRELAYHFEYIGHLVKNKKVKFDLIFDPITFPDWLIDDSILLRQNARTFLPDFWDGVIFLYYQYEYARVSNRIKKIVQTLKISGIYRLIVQIQLFGYTFHKDTHQLRHKKLVDLAFGVAINNKSIEKNNQVQRKLDIVKQKIEHKDRNHNYSMDQKTFAKCTYLIALLKKEAIYIQRAIEKDTSQYTKQCREQCINEMDDVHQKIDNLRNNEASA